MERDLIERCMGQLDEIARTHDRIATGDIGICIDCASRSRRAARRESRGEPLHRVPDVARESGADQRR
jgi:RNA polymerase-binding transcription factor DksA